MWPLVASVGPDSRVNEMPVDVHGDEIDEDLESSDTTVLKNLSRRVLARLEPVSDPAQAGVTEP